MTLDSSRDVSGKPPPADQDGAHQRVVDPELATLEPNPLVGADEPATGLLELAVHSRQDQVPEVVDESGHRQLVAVRQPHLLGDPVRRMAGGHSVAAELLVTGGRAGRHAERIVGLDRRDHLAQAGCVKRLDGLPDAARSAAARRLAWRA